MEPATTFALPKLYVAGRVASTIAKGDDPSLISAAALFTPVPTGSENLPEGANPLEQVGETANDTALASPELPNSPETGQEVVLEHKLLATRESENGQVQEYIVAEKQVDARYLEHGNLKDAWLDARRGELSFDTFMLALVDILDTLTLGVLRPMLLEVKLNPHLKARQVQYRVDVSYDTIETPATTTETADGTVSEATRIQKRLTQVEKVSVDISPELLDKAEISFAEAAARMQQANLARETQVWARLDQLTEHDVRCLAADGNGYQLTHSQRVQSYVSPEGKQVELRELSAEELQDAGVALIQDRERITHTAALVEQTPEEASLTFISEEAKDRWLLRKSTTRHYLSEAEQTRTTTIDTTVKEHDHLAGEGELLEQHRHQAEEIIHSVSDVAVEKTHFAPPSFLKGSYAETIGQKGKSWFGEATTTTLTQREQEVTTTISEDGRELGSTTAATNSGETQVLKSFENGSVEDWYLIGGLGHAVSKSSLAGVGELTRAEVGMAALDAAGIALTVVTAGKGAALVVPLKEGGKAAFRAGARAVAKVQAKDALREAGQKTLAQVAGDGSVVLLPTSGSSLKGTFKGALRLGNKGTAAKVATQAQLPGGLKQTGRLDLGTTGAGAKAAAPEAGTVVRPIRLPVNNGSWAGEKGNSFWRLDPNFVHPDKNINPMGKDMRTICREQKLPNGILFKNQYPVFSPVCRAEESILDFTENRARNFAQARSRLADEIRQGELVHDDILNYLKENNIARTDITPAHIRDMEHNLNLTWHEMPDMKTLQLMPSELHGAIPHSGGISRYKELHNL